MLVLSSIRSSSHDNGNLIRENLLREAIMNPEPFLLNDLEEDIENNSSTKAAGEAEAEAEAEAKAKAKAKAKDTVVPETTSPAQQKQKDIAEDLKDMPTTELGPPLLVEAASSVPPSLVIGGAASKKPTSAGVKSNKYQKREAVADELEPSSSLMPSAEPKLDEVVALTDPVAAVTGGHYAKDMICDVHHTVALASADTLTQWVGGEKTSTATTLRCYRLNMDSVHFDSSECKTTEGGHVVCEKQILAH